QLDTTVYLVPAKAKLEMLSDKVADYALNTLGFKGKLNEKFVYLGPNTDNVVVVGLGTEEDLTRDQYVQAASTAAKILNEQKITSTSAQVTTYGTVDESEVLQGIAEGFLQTDYSFDYYKKDKTSNSLTKISLLTDLENADTLHKEEIILNEKKITYNSAQVTKYGTVDESEVLQGIAEGFLQTDYSFDYYKKDKTSNSLTKVSLLTDLENADTLIEEVINVLKSVNVTRDLVNTPANDLYPETLATKVEELFEGTQVDVEVFNKNDLEELGAKALLAVSQGSAKEPRMLVLKYLPLGNEEPVISLVGKGVTYDSGGYALKN